MAFFVKWFFGGWVGVYTWVVFFNCGSCNILSGRIATAWSRTQ